MRFRSLPACVALALLVTACAEPPNKEIGQAQGAIDAARAVGADKYAAAEYSAATAAMTQANDAVTQRDYRLALNHALESLEHGQNAAREAAETQGRIRAEVERAMAEVAGLLAQANLRLAAAEKARISRVALRQAQQLLAQVNDDVQKASEKRAAGDFIAAQAALDGIKRRIQEAIATLDAATIAQSQRRRR
jgi:hypothetical protein